MKKFILSAATAAAALTTLSADQFYVIMKDGSVESYPTEKVDSISFNDPQIAKIMGFNEMAAELVKLKARVAALEAKSGTVVDTSATSNASDLRYFVINDKEVEVVGTINGSADVVIPETALVNGKIYTVTSIAQEAFKNQNRIKTVSLPKTLKNIGELAFYGCNSLTSIEIPSGVTSIADQAFCVCSSLKSINIPSSVTSIGYAAFEGCSGLTKLTVPSSVVSIDRDAFYACDNLDLVIDNSRSNVECENGVIGVKSLTFTGSPLLFKVMADGGVAVRSGKGGDHDEIYRQMKSITIPTEAEINGKKYSVTAIEDYAFTYCEQLTSVEIPSSVTSIGSNAFNGCRGLTKLTVPSSVTSIGNSAFSGCKELDVVIDNSRSNVECRDAFNGVKSVTFTGSQFLFRVLDDGKSAKITYADYSGYESITIPSEAEINGKMYPVTAIGDSAFRGCSSLASIEIPSSVTSIGYSAFYGCSSLTSIEIPSSVTSIGSWAFRGCESLTSIEIPSSVTSIGESAFRGCEELDVVIDNSRSNVECYYSFDGVKSVTFTGSPLLFRVLEDGSGVELTNSYGEFDDVYPSLESVKIPSEVEINGKKYPVTSISYFAFAGCHNLTSIEIPSSVTSIGQWAFQGCFGLTSIEIPSSVTSIGSSAFMDCERLDVVVDNSRSNVECGGAFYGVNSLTFTGSPLLFRVLEDGSGVEVTCSTPDGDDVYPSLKSVKIPSEVEINGKKYPVTSIGDRTFWRCDNLTSVEIPSSVTSIGYYAFAYCSSLASIEIPSSVTSIDEYAFVECQNLDVVIDNSKENIPEFIFENCKSVTYLK
ncbi:MAG: leucine-rich repeat domain-containing protein [Paludibacteraceae bacterium]|nr:leucine-rich repeat domain-containing protein [Paludibacteraceae bacterium]